jgi:predicted metal-dependent phosphoesterase TrpH
MGRAAGARMSLAHPHTLRSRRWWRLVRRHQREGLEGIEALYGRYPHAEREVWLRLAQADGLVVTGGSDFHGDAMPEVHAAGDRAARAARGAPARVARGRHGGAGAA